MSFRAHYGEIEHHPAEPLGRHLSIWSMGLMPFSPPEVTMGSLRVQTYDETTQD
jgi:hypothetical protein